MAYTIDQFGFEPIDQIPVDENDWGCMLNAFCANSEATIIKKDFGDKTASNAASAIRKAAEKLGLDKDIEVITKKGVVYISKIFPRE